MRNYKRININEKGDICEKSYRHEFFFKVNGYKMSDVKKLTKQIKNIQEKIKSKYKIDNAAEIKFKKIGDDFANDTFHVRLSYDCNKQKFLIFAK